MLFVITPSPSETTATALGLVAGRRVGSAVDRNRAKRRLRAAVRVLGGKPGHDVVIVAGRAILEVGWSELVDWVAEGLGVGHGEVGHGRSDRPAGPNG